ncbi:EcpB family pilus assembly chaperone [Chromobacterium haemolyticum]|uniref:EcpB family pilus assembly chaperone n=1 Tax=Chromobacterium TaxID=535 RepID=UPI004055BC6F
MTRLMMIKAFGFSLACCMVSSTVWALGFDELAIFLASDQQQVSQRIRNPAASAKLVTVKVEPMDSPETMNVIAITSQQRDELLFTPSRLILPAGGDFHVRFIYQGPKDDKERYYKITWDGVDVKKKNEDSSSPQVQSMIETRISISTTLVVLPRHARYDYHFDNQKISNSGNATLELSASGPCLDKAKKHCNEVFPLLPGKTKAFKEVDLASKEAVVMMWKNKKGELLKHQ